ncbi:MAG: hypothetical protein MMC23_005064 [Stictis urceolatum]|nr:hypothetical protein [Stictis urceolata]
MFKFASNAPDSDTRLSSELQIEDLKLFYAGNYIWNAVNSLSRLSAVLLYARVFTMENRKFRWAVRTAIALVAIRATIGIVGTGLLCMPASKAWTMRGDTTCGHGTGLFKVGQVLFIVIDIFILGLPLPLLWQLKLNLKQRLLVGIALFYGYCVPIVSIGTLVVNLQAHGSLENVITWRSLTLLYWMLIEAPLAVTTICLPPIFFLIKRRFHRLSRSSSRTLGDTGSGERLKSVDSSGLRAGYRDPEKSESWGSSPPDTKDRSSNKPLPTSPASNSPWRLSHLAPRPLPISISKPRRSTEKQHERSRSVPKPRYPPLAPLNDDNGTPTSPPVELSSNLLHPADIQPEYQAMIYTPPVIPGVRRTQEDVQCGMIRVQREVNVEVRDQHSERPLKDMLDTGLGLGRHSGTSGKRDSDGSGKWDSR